MHAWSGLVAAMFSFAGIVRLASCGPPSSPALQPVVPTRPPTVEAALGCWQIAATQSPLGSWLPDGARFQLDSIAERWDSTRAPTALRVVRLGSDSAAAHVRLAGWGAEVASEWLDIWMGNGFTGVKLHVRQHGDTLEGTEQPFQDSPPYQGDARIVRATRVACGSERSSTEGERIPAAG